MLFLADEVHGYYEKAKLTRRHPHMGRRADCLALRSSKVPERQKETAALKIKTAASLARENVSAVRRLFFFCRRAAVHLIFGQSAETGAGL